MAGTREQPMRFAVLRFSILCFCCALLVGSCTGSEGADPESQTTTSDSVETTTGGGDAAAMTTEVKNPVVVDPNSHTVPTLRSVSDFEQLAKDGIAGQSVLKFSVTEFSSDPEIEWLDSSFYTLHDEWYWFQLLNGRPIRGLNVSPPDIDEAPFPTVADVYAWAETRRATLPLDLSFTATDRLFSLDFYDAATDSSASRSLAAGALLRSPDRDGGPDRWLIELEFRDDPDVDQINTYFDVISATVSDEIASNLFWVPRSRDQEQTAAEIESGSGPNKDRIVRYDELAEPGEVQVYSPAISAGRLLVVTDGGRWSLGDAGPNDIVAIDRAPDDLPPGNGLITGTPQTPLAHVNVLALNRGIPNAYLAGLADDTTIAQLGRVRARVLVQTTGDGELNIIPLTNEEYDGWLATAGSEEISVEPVDLGSTRYTEDLDSLVATAPTSSDLEALRPVIGGKAAGFIELALPGTTTMPPDPMVITVRSYDEHMTQFDPVVDALLSDSALDSPRLRHLVLEGREDFDARYTTTGDAALADEFEKNHPAETPLGAALEADGFVKLIRDSSISPDTIDALSDTISENFDGLAATQGLRFRSSSSVEDIEGFNGAGLYDSNTGYLDPTVLPDEDDHKRTVERAVLRTWSSYWSAAAFEERLRENVDQRSGAMAVLVHPRFDDPLEIDNGVATLTVNPDPTTAYEMVVNVQEGDTSVTNDDNEDDLTPEIVRFVVAETGAAPQIERISTSSIADPDMVLDDDDLAALFDQLRSVSDSWLGRSNQALPQDQHSSTLTLDFEFREMAEGWPARADGSSEPSRMVVKQARTLDPGLRGMSAELLALPIPRDVLAHAISAVEYSCVGSKDVGVRILTDPQARVDLGYAEAPFELWGAGTSMADLRDADSPTNAAPDGLNESDCENRNVITSPTRYLLDLLATR